MLLLFFEGSVGKTSGQVKCLLYCFQPSKLGSNTLCLVGRAFCRQDLLGVGSLALFG